MKVSGTVTLTIDELDGLRGSISDEKAKVRGLEEKVKQLEADQLQVRVTVAVRNHYVEDVKVVDYEATAAQQRLWNSNMGAGSYERSHMYDRYPDQVYTYQSVMKEKMVEKIEYVHFDDVLGDLKAKAESDVIDQITSLKNEVTRLKNSISDKEADYYTKLTSNNKVKDHEIDALKITHEKEIKLLVNEIKRLKDEEIESTKDNLIKELHKEIAILKSKPWYKF